MATLSYPDPREVMARAYQTEVYSLREIADYFGLHCVHRKPDGKRARVPWPAHLHGF